MDAVADTRNSALQFGPDSRHVTTDQDDDAGLSNDCLNDHFFSIFAETYGKDHIKNNELTDYDPVRVLRSRVPPRRFYRRIWISITRRILRGEAKTYFVMCDD